MNKEPACPPLWFRMIFYVVVIGVVKSHHTHACQTCGMVWRPAIIATVGVQFLPGFKDEENS